MSAPWPGEFRVPAGAKVGDRVTDRASGLEWKVTETGVDGDEQLAKISRALETIIVALEEEDDHAE